MAADIPVHIHLCGEAGQQDFPAEWTLLLSNPSPAEAFRAIDANTGGRFRRYLLGEGRQGHYQVAIGRPDNDLSEEELVRPSGRQDIYLLPIVAGQEKAGAKILAAVAIAVITYFTFGVGAPFASADLALAGYSAAASLAIGGIVQLLTPVPSFNQSNEDGKRSNLFQGNATSIAQGAAVPLIYGRALAIPMPISVAFIAKDQAIVNSFAPQTYEVVTGPGGVIDYKPVNPGDTDHLPA